MKKVLVFFMVLVFTLSMTLNALAVPGKGKGNGGNKAEVQAGADVSDKVLMKQFKQELNQLMKDPIAAYQDELEALTAEYDALKAEIDAIVVDPLAPDFDQAALDAKTAKEALLANLDGQIAAVNARLDMDPESLQKQLINERFMVIKSDKSGFDLSSYDSAEALIAAMYSASQDKNVWSLWVNKSETLLKLEGPLYLKGSKIMFPLGALADLGAEVTWDEFTRTVTVVGANGVTVIFSPEGKTATAKVSVADGALNFSDGANPGEKIGAFTGTLIDPVTKLVYNLEASVTLNFEYDVATGLITDETIDNQNISADIVNPATGEVVKTVNIVLSGVLSDPEFTFDDATLDVATSNTITNCGRAYHPLDELVDLFGLEAAADVDEGIVEVAPAEEVPAEIVPDLVPEV